MRRCSQAGCGEQAGFLPVFHLCFAGETAPRRFEVRLEVCRSHAVLIGRALASPARRSAWMRELADDGIAIDWHRSRVEFVATERPAGSATEPADWLS